MLERGSERTPLGADAYVCATFDDGFRRALDVHAWRFSRLCGQHHGAHGLSVAREFERDLFLELLTYDVIAAHGFLRGGQRGFVRVEDVHFLDEDG